MPAPIPGLPQSSAHVTRSAGSNPTREATPSTCQIPTPIILTAAPVARLGCIRHIPQVLAPRAFSPVGDHDSRGGVLNPGVEAGPQVFVYQFSAFSS